MHKYAYWAPMLASLALVLLLIIGPHIKQQRPHPLVGQHAPLSTMLDLSDQPYDMSALDGQAYIVHFWATWCMFCRSEHNTWQTLTAKIDTSIIGIAYKDGNDNIEHFLSKEGKAYTRDLADHSGQAAIHWGVSGVPTTFFINENGVIFFVREGPITQQDFELFKSRKT